MTAPLVPHRKQVFALACMRSNPSLALFYGTGTGKTATALLWMDWKLDREPDARFIVVCPANLVPSWEDAIGGMARFEGFDQGRVDRLREAVTLVSYQRLYRTEKRKYTKRDGRTGEAVTVYIRDDYDREWTAGFVDESQRLGNHGSIQTNACLALAPLCKNRYIMTGTPVHGGGGRPDYSKLYGQIMFLDPEKWKNWSEWKRTYVVAEDRYHKPSAYRDDMCVALMHEYGIVARLEDCVDMPSITYTDVPCPLAEPGVYRELHTGDGRAKYGIRVRKGGLKSKLLQLCSGQVIGTDGLVPFKTSKDGVLEDIIDGTEGPVLIFCSNRGSIDRVEGLVRKKFKDLRVAVFDGRSTTPVWRGINEGKLDVLVCQYKSGGTGLNLQSSSTLVMWEPDPSAETNVQTVARIYRTGQARPCRVLRLTTPGTAEAERWAKVNNGVSDSEATLDEWEEYEASSFGVAVSDLYDYDGPEESDEKTSDSKHK